MRRHRPGAALLTDCSLQVAGEVAAVDATKAATAFAAAGNLTTLQVATAAPLLTTGPGLDALRRLTLLQHLVLRHQPLVYDAGPTADASGGSPNENAAALVRALAALTLLATLDMQHCALDEAAAQAGLADALARLERLRTVSFAHNRLGTAVPTIAAVALALPAVQAADLSHNQYLACAESGGSWGDSEGQGESAAEGSEGRMTALRVRAQSRGVQLTAAEPLPRTSSCQSSRLPHANRGASGGGNSAGRPNGKRRRS